MITRKFSLFAMLLCLNGIVFADGVVFTVSDPKWDDDTKITIYDSIANEIQPGDLDLVSLSAESHGDTTIFKATFAKPIKAPDSRVISQAGTTLKSYAPNGFYTFNLDIYVDTDGIPGSGKTGSLPGRNAQIHPEFAWEKVICLNPRPQQGRLALQDEMRRIALNEFLVREGRLSREDVTEVEMRVKSETEQDIYFPTLIHVHGATVQFSVPNSFFEREPEREWGYAAGVTISSVVERINHAGARSLRNPAAGPSDVLQLPSLTVQENLTLQSREPAYVDLILPVVKDGTRKP